MTELFSEEIFAPLPKREASLPSNKKDIRNQMMFEMIYCVNKGYCVSMVECIDCVLPTRKDLQVLLETGVGCE